MYKAPIELISSPPKFDYDGEIYKAVVKCGVSVDKDELIKALQYDRGQYDKGYADAKTETAREIFGEIEREYQFYRDAFRWSSVTDSALKQFYESISKIKKKYTEEQT